MLHYIQYINSRFWNTASRFKEEFGNTTTGHEAAGFSTGSMGPNAPPPIQTSSSTVGGNKRLSTKRGSKGTRCYGSRQGAAARRKTRSQTSTLALANIQYCIYFIYGFYACASKIVFTIFYISYETYLCIMHLTLCRMLKMLYSIHSYVCIWIVITV